MNRLAAFALGRANRGLPCMVFDWVKAARLIKKIKPTIASAGLRSDWEYTGGTIWKDGKPTYEYTYLASAWATPEIKVDGKIFECYVMESETDWNEETRWPPEALKILNIDK